MVSYRGAGTRSTWAACEIELVPDPALELTRRDDTGDVRPGRALRPPDWRIGGLDVSEIRGPIPFLAALRGVGR